VNTILLLVIGLAGGFIFWNLAVGLISLAGGWHSMAKSHRLPERHLGSGRVFTFQSVILGLLGNYRSCVNVTIHDEGIIMRPVVPYRFLHDPIFIAWSGISGAVRSGFFIFKGVSFRAGKRNITLRGKSAEEVLKRLAVE
jgi:hypothetical protein